MDVIQKLTPTAEDKQSRQIKYTNTAKAALPVFQASRRLTLSIENLFASQRREVFHIKKFI